MNKYPHDFKREGGKWVGQLRTRVQTMFRNGEEVGFDSNDKLEPQATIKDVTELGSYAVTGYHEEIVEPLIKLLTESYDLINAKMDKSPDIDKLLDRIHYAIYNKPRWLGEMLRGDRA